MTFVRLCLIAAPQAYSSAQRASLSLPTLPTIPLLRRFINSKSKAMTSPDSSLGSKLPNVAPTKLGTASVDESIDLELSEAKWVGLKLLSWTDQDRKERRWEMAIRKTTGKGGVDAVAIAAVLRHPSRPPSIPIILQYRPPIAEICVELPAGLIDGSETAETAALRELYEETGYGGDAFKGRIKVVEIGGIIYSDPGMTAANMNLAHLEVALEEGEEEPSPHLDEGEHIEVRVTPMADLYQHLQAYEKLGYKVDARLHHYAAGIMTAQRLGLINS